MRNCGTHEQTWQDSVSGRYRKYVEDVRGIQYANSTSDGERGDKRTVYRV
jgi:hypothetical protein